MIEFFLILFVLELDSVLIRFSFNYDYQEIVVEENEKTFLWYATLFSKLYVKRGLNSLSMIIENEGSFFVMKIEHLDLILKMSN